jgi:hypothetical protein
MVYSKQLITHMLEVYCRVSADFRDAWICAEVVVAAASTGLPPELKSEISRISWWLLRCLSRQLGQPGLLRQQWVQGGGIVLLMVLGLNQVHSERNGDVGSRGRKKRLSFKVINSMELVFGQQVSLYCRRLETITSSPHKMLKM